MQAPTTTIETVTVVRPLKVIALLFLILATVLLAVCLACTTWLKTENFRTGLFEECSAEKPTGPLPPYAPKAGSCQMIAARGKVYIKAVAALLVIAGLLTLAAAVITGIGLKTMNASRKYLFYRLALYVALLSVVLALIALVVFPVCFYTELKDWGETSWDFDWAYGVAWGATLFSFASAILLICDKEHEEIYYKEKTVFEPSSKALIT